MTPQQAALDALTIGLKYTVEYGTHKEAMEIRAQIEALTQAQAVSADDVQNIRDAIYHSKRPNGAGASLDRVLSALQSGAGLEALLAKVPKDWWWKLSGPDHENEYGFLMMERWGKLDAKEIKAYGPTPTAAIEAALNSGEK